MTAEAALGEVLAAAAARHFGGRVLIEGLQRLSGGASRETWAFSAAFEDGTRRPLILRRDPGTASHEQAPGGAPAIGIGRAQECRLLERVVGCGVPAPPIRFAMPEATGGGFVMDRIAGETAPRHILGAAEFAMARRELTRQCGTALALIHATPADDLGLPRLDAGRQLALYRSLLDHFGEPQPTFELALRRLADTLPTAVPLCLVHGDFRTGNLLVGPEGLLAVLDWELAHLGDPMEDLGWLCVKSWRFGRVASPVGGFGTREALYAAYAAARGVPVDPGRVRFWEVCGTLRWGVICMHQAFTHLTGQHRSVELAAIGRRVSETELDLLDLLED